MNLSSKNKPNNFQDVQRVFTQHMRDPENNPAPENIESRRINVYSELVYNNINSFMESSFPVIRAIIDDDKWSCIMRDYIKRHKAHTPMFPKMPQEFLQYLWNERNNDDYHFLPELAHYEWIETSLSIDAREINFNNIDNEGDLLTGVPVISHLALPLVYSWPVQKISPDYLPQNKPKEPTYIVVYRNLNDEVSFMVLNNISARLTEKLQNNSTHKSGEEVLVEISKELNHPKPDTVINGGLQIMSDFRDRNIILGVISNK